MTEAGEARGERRSLAGQLPARFEARVDGFRMSRLDAIAQPFRLYPGARIPVDKISDIERIKMQTTITEALQEIKTIGKRIEKKRANLGQYVARDARLKDPLAGDGGSVAFITQEQQSIGDLASRVVAIRTAIQRSNLETQVTIEGTTRSVAEWLTWRREVAPGEQQFLTQLAAGIAKIRADVQKRGAKTVTATTPDSDTGPGDVIVHLDEKALMARQETMEKVLGELDGKLSLLNATTVIEV